ncbi:MAG: CHASE3 domain-containing protein [Hydrogenophaga sp.]|jgi:signal transduction histidine kinase|uniref:sensor histidine kinase n=1 Tax=Hydrogenophaga sp. TaxID=1904254 RepID=UPI002622A8DA|nr:ATP-binding protein [Hydrogenophaga sp.]MCV0439112.1 CHASE3 domain-containing protein [Hydrogenophaga sp.]
MIKSSINRVVRTHYAMPIIVALAVITMAITESTYQHSRSTLAQGITLTDARLQAARTLQTLTDAETAARAYINSTDAGDLENYREAINEMESVRKGVFQLLTDLDPQRTLALGDVGQHIDARAATLEQWVRLAEQGRAARAQELASGDQGRLRYAELRQEFEFVLERAAAIQTMARVSLYDALLINRVALHGLVLLAVVALLLFLRQLRESDRREAQEHERLTTQVALRTTALRNLAGHHVHAREDERGRVARELHDEMGGLLTAMKLEIARLRRVPDVPAAALERLAGIELRLNEGIAVKRRIVEHLRPSSLDQLGLIPALDMLCRDAGTGLGIPVHMHLSPVELDKDAELTVYRLVQESLTNVRKYAQARQVLVELGQTGTWVRVLVRDDGLGFDTESVPAGHHGLMGMRVRVESHAGRLDVTSTPGSGTCVQAELPARVPTVSADTGPG